MSIRKIAAFVAIAEAGSVSAAAQRLSMSPAALSESLADLEAEIGAELFIRRKARGVTLAPAGRRLLIEARRFVRHAEEFQALIDQPGADLAGEFLVGCFHSLLPFVIPKLLPPLLHRYPDVRLQFVEQALPQLQQLILDGVIDLAVMYDIDLGDDIERHRLYDCSPYVLLSPEHPDGGSSDPIDLSDLIEQPYIQFDALPGRNDYISSLLGLTPRTAFRTTNFEMVRALVARNLGYAVLVQRPIHNVSYEGLPLVIRPIANPIPPLAVVVGWPRSTHRQRRLRAFVTFCEEVLGERR